MRAQGILIRLSAVGASVALLVGGLGMATPAAAAPPGLEWSKPKPIPAGDGKASSLGGMLAVTVDESRWVAGFRTDKGRPALVESVDAGGAWKAYPEPDPSRGEAEFDNQSVPVAAADNAPTVVGTWAQSNDVSNAFATTWVRAATVENGQQLEAQVPLPSSGSVLPKVAVSPDGRKSMIIWNESPFPGYYNAFYSADAGKTFASAGNRINPTEAFPDSRRLAFDSEGRAWLAWIEKSSPRAVWATVYDPSSGTWDAKKVFDGPAYGLTLAMAPDAKGSATRGVLSWTVTSDTTSKAKSSVWASTLSGSTWSAANLVADPVEPAYGTRSTITSDGSRVVVGWLQNTGGLTTVSASTSTDGGAKYNPPTVVAQSQYVAQNLELDASDDGQTVLAGWLAGSGYGKLLSVKASVSTNGGQDWGPDAQVSTAGGTATFPQVFVLDQGKKLLASWTTANLGMQFATSVATADPPAGTPSTQQPTAAAKVTSVTAKAVGAGKGKLNVRIRPDLGADKQWKFRVKKKRKSGDYTFLKKDGKVRQWKTQSVKHTRILDLTKGKYKVRVVKNQRGYKGSTSKVVTLKK